MVASKCYIIDRMEHLTDLLKQSFSVQTSWVWDCILHPIYLHGVNQVTRDLSSRLRQAKKEDIDKAVGSKREEGREMRSQLNTMRRAIC